MKIQINPLVELIDPVRGQILDKRTGKVFEVSQETLSLLSEFTSPREVGENFDNLHTVINSDDLSIIIEFLSNLLKQEILVSDISKEEPCISSVGLSDIALVEKPCLSFLSVPVCELGSDFIYDIAMFGTPFDLGSTGYPGSRFGPSRMRELSSYGMDYRANFKDLSCAGWLVERGKKLCDGLRIVDIGDVIHQIGEPVSNFFKRLEKVTKLLIDRNVIPISIGGDHSCTYSSVKGVMSGHQNSHLIIFDAHTDLADYDSSISHNHGNFVSRLLREGLVKKVTHIGLRGMVGKPFEKEGYSAIYADQCVSYSKIVEKLKISNEDNVYISFDVDSIDPSLAPGTGTPVPQGLSPEFVCDVITHIVRKNNVVGMDVVEYNPMRDVNDMTGNLLIQMLPKILDSFRRREFD